ncbi:hypothetical protein, partial [Salmonella sp. SAL04286]|uniref:hypothetical protein n=1 Tax=Salmonella sp. SAL04286 TaxID=3159864 RepID=UPI003978BBE3
PTPKPGTALCAYGNGGNWNGWPVANDWHVANGQLLNDGTAYAYNGDIPTLIAPQDCQPSTADFAVEVQVQVTAPGTGNGST